ncbi:hypothetical protein [Pseudomonas piscis]|uniref:hypothetical protein n=1 Tax=Pseudomonas piscis TaxID=2614538 RepID=UPI0021D60295|nr:hypothetical protein [Pseudomonas piscis]MCU7649480.1 hypothetical protein [Pseudomonas piscis]
MADAIGLRVRDRFAGKVTLDITDRLTRRIGVVNSGESASSITVNGFSLGNGWAIVLEAPVPDPDFVEWIFPKLSISENVLSWDFPGPEDAFVVPCDIMYGVY